MDYADHIFGKSPKLFPPTERGCWTTEQILGIFEELKKWPNMRGQRFGVQLAIVTDPSEIKIGDTFLQISGDLNQNQALRKNIVRIEQIENQILIYKHGDVKVFGPCENLYKLVKLWPDIAWAFDFVATAEDFIAPTPENDNNGTPVVYFRYSETRKP
jgi:hypothetical protein